MTKAQIETYRAALKEARESFNQARNRLLAIGFEELGLRRDLARLRRTITALAAMCSEDPLMDSLGITESCTEIMQNENESLTTADVVKRLEQIGFDVDSQKNIAASVHAVLSRLATKRIIRKEMEEETKTILWKGPNYDPFVPPDEVFEEPERESQD